MLPDFKTIGRSFYDTMTTTQVTAPAWSVATAIVFAAIIGSPLVGIGISAVLIVPATLKKKANDANPSPND